MIIKKISFMSWVNGMVIWPFLFVQNKTVCEDKVFMNHERIHARQQLEMLLIPFFLWYGIEYLILRFKYNHDVAYRNIVFEREAYHMECELDYLKSRKYLNFARFYSKKFRL